MKATVGRIVHFHEAGSGGKSPQAAIVTQVFDKFENEVNLVVFEEGGFSFRHLVQWGSDHWDSENEPYWTWPPRA